MESADTGLTPYQNRPRWPLWWVHWPIDFFYSWIFWGLSRGGRLRPCRRGCCLTIKGCLLRSDQQLDLRWGWAGTALTLSLEILIFQHRCISFLSGVRQHFAQGFKRFFCLSPYPIIVFRFRAKIHILFRQLDKNSLPPYVPPAVPLHAPVFSGNS